MSSANEQLGLLKQNSSKVWFPCIYCTVAQLMKYPGMLVEHCDILVINFPSMTKSNIAVHIKMWFYSSFMIVRLMLIKLLS